MSVIHFERSHQLSISELKSRIEKIAAKLTEQLSVSVNWETEHQLSFHKKGANGNIEISENHFHLTLKLGMMYKVLQKPIRLKIESTIDQYIH